MEYFAPYSYVGIFVFLVLTGCGLPIPEEVGIIYAGIQSAAGNLIWWLALLACFLGALVGDSMMYWGGRHFGRRLLSKNGWMSRVLTPETEVRAEKLIRHHGLKVFFGARFLVGVRGPIYVTAGILRVPFSRFLIADGISAAVVVGSVFALAYFFGRAVGKWIHDSQLAFTIIVVCVVAVVGLLGYWHWRKKMKLVDEEEVPPDDEQPSTFFGLGHEAEHPPSSEQEARDQPASGGTDDEDSGLRQVANNRA